VDYRFGVYVALCRHGGGPDGLGQYWRGAVWPPIQCMVQEGLKQNGRRDLARRLAERYFQAVVETFASQGDITENLAPDRPLACGCGKFVGWGGIGPVANLIEYILGLDVCVPESRITWHVRRTEKHGIRNLWLGGFPVDMICRKRGAADDPCHLMIHSGGPFTLIVTTGREEREIKVAKGVTELTLE